MAQITTGVVRASYVYLAKKNKDGKYALDILIKKTDKATIQKITDCVEDAVAYGVAEYKPWGGKAPKKEKLIVLRDGDDRDDEDENYAGHYYIPLTSKNMPGLVDRELNEILDAEEIYAGCYIRAQISIVPMSFEGQKMLGRYINHIQFWKDGEALGGGRTSPSAAFDDDFDEKPAKKKKRPADDDEDEEPVRKKKKKRPVDDDDDIPY